MGHLGVQHLLSLCLEIKEKPLLNGRERGGVVGKGKEKAVHNLLSSG